MALQWTAILIGGLLVGGSAVGLLVVPKGRESLFFILGLAGVVTGNWGVVVAVTTYDKTSMTVATLGISFAAVGGGYALASALLPYLTITHSAPKLPDTIERRNLPPLVLLLAEIESERYAPTVIAQELQRLAAAGLPETTMSIAPFVYAAQKARYRALGGTSPATRQAKSVAEQLEAELTEEFGGVRFVSCVGRDTLDHAVIRAATEGFTDIIVAELSVGESYAVNQAKTAVDMLRPESLGLRIIYTPPFWSSDDLCAHVADQIWKAREDEPERTGVALILHGQPDAWQKSHTTFDVEENSFVNRVRSILVERGLSPEHVRLCYAEWRNPDITETVRHLAALGCSRVLVSPACFPFEDSVTILDTQVSIRQARVDEQVSTITLGAWGDGPAMKNGLCKLVRAAAKDLG